MAGPLDYTYQITKFIYRERNEAYIQLLVNVEWMVLIHPSLDFIIQLYS